jgi:hypothetical protein
MVVPPSRKNLRTIGCNVAHMGKQRRAQNQKRFPKLLPGVFLFQQAVKSIS